MNTPSDKTPAERTWLGVELLAAYLNRENVDASTYISERLTASITDPTAPTHGEYTAGLLFLAELLVLHLAHQLDPTADVRDKALEVLQHMSPRLPE